MTHRILVKATLCEFPSWIVGFDQKNKLLLFKNMLQFFSKKKFSKQYFCVKEKEAFLGLFWNVPFVGSIIRELRHPKLRWPSILEKLTLLGWRLWLLEYVSTLAASTSNYIIIFRNVEIFRKYFFLRKKKYLWRNLQNLCEYFYFILTWKLQI